MEYLYIKNWERYQHYSKRRPPWIKLYWSLLTEPSFVLISDASKLHTIAIMLLASQHDNRLPFNKAWISRAIQANARINWDEVLSTGFILCEHDASTTLASSKHDASPRARSRETETETETETEADMPRTDSKSESSSLASGGPPVCMIPLANRTEHPVTQALVDEFAELYPGVDVVLELKGMRGWCLAHPKQCKTKTGVRAFMTSWLAREQNRSRAAPGNGGRPTDPIDTSWILDSGRTHGKRSGGQVSDEPHSDQLSAVQARSKPG